RHVGIHERVRSYQGCRELTIEKDSGRRWDPNEYLSSNTRYRAFQDDVLVTNNVNPHWAACSICENMRLRLELQSLERIDSRGQSYVRTRANCHVGIWPRREGLNSSGWRDLQKRGST